MGVVARSKVRTTDGASVAFSDTQRLLACLSLYHCQLPEILLYLGSDVSNPCLFVFCTLILEERARLVLKGRPTSLAASLSSLTAILIYV